MAKQQKVEALLGVKRRAKESTADFLGRVMYHTGEKLKDPAERRNVRDTVLAVLKQWSPRMLVLFFASIGAALVFGADVVSQAEPVVSEKVGNVIMLVGVVWEAITRLYPTAKDWSIVSHVFGFLGRIFPNRVAGGRSSEGWVGGKVVVRR